MIRHCGIFAFTAVALSACASFTPAQVAKPSDITLDKALKDVAASLHDLQAKYAKDKKIGMMVDEVQVQFAIAVTASNGGQAELHVAAIPIGTGGGTLGASAQEQQSATANRGNTITVTFKNVATADLSKGSIAVLSAAAAKGGKGDKSDAPKWTPEQLAALQKLLDQLKVFDQKGLTK